jgi:putative two-component system response regulator
MGLSYSIREPVGSESNTNAKILFVDDEHSILGLVQRSFGQKFDIHVTDSAKEGLLSIEQEGGFAVVISDYRMPGTDGATFLAQVAGISPDSIRMMLTGCAQLEASIRAVNEGHVHRFLMKPCPMNVLEKAITDGLHQYHLVQTEREYHALKKWNEGIGGLVQSLVRLIESKDPYTAEHQFRVSQLSVEIAKALGFPEETIEQIRMTAMIHDIGKIYVPAEFLNRSGGLNSSEWDIVKMHAQSGHDILSPIGFPFPLQEIVLQHHERIDGSGYPRGLKGSEIRVEAKIIAVADVIEAITHHRPYRPAKGIEEAIRELADNQGKKYDRVISEAAIKILSEKTQEFE